MDLAKFTFYTTPYLRRGTYVKMQRWIIEYRKENSKNYSPILGTMSRIFLRFTKYRRKQVESGGVGWGGGFKLISSRFWPSAKIFLLEARRCNRWTLFYIIIIRCLRVSTTLTASQSQEVRVVERQRLILSTRGCCSWLIFLGPSIL